MLRTPTLAGARVTKKPTISFQFFAASPRPPSAFERSGKEMVGFFGFASSLQNSSLIRFATWRIRSLFLRDSRTGCYLQRGVLRTQSLYVLAPNTRANAQVFPPMRAHGEQSSLLPKLQQKYNILVYSQNEISRSNRWIRS